MLGGFSASLFLTARQKGCKGGGKKLCSDRLKKGCNIIQLIVPYVLVIECPIELQAGVPLEIAPQYVWRGCFTKSPINTQRPSPDSYTPFGNPLAKPKLNSAYSL